MVFLFFLVANSLDTFDLHPKIAERVNMHFQVHLKQKSNKFKTETPEDWVKGNL
jgi:hypothetical protein